MKTHLVLKFQAGLINNVPMTLKITVNNIAINQPVTEQFQVAVDVELPSVVNFELTDKLATDTITVNNQIVADKFIKLESIELDGLEIDSWKIPAEYLYLETENTVHYSAYWGFNGTAKLIIDHDDPAFWLLECPAVTRD
jgi:hypothetical protein